MKEVNKLFSHSSEIINGYSHGGGGGLKMMDIVPIGILVQGGGLVK